MMDVDPAAPIHGFYLASVGAARRLPYSLGTGSCAGRGTDENARSNEPAFWAVLALTCAQIHRTRMRKT